MFGLGKKKKLMQQLDQIEGSSKVDNTPRNEIHSYEPHCYNDVLVIADSLKTKNTVIIDLSRVKSESKRLIDFLSGVIYVIQGSATHIKGKTLYMFSPNAELSIDEETVCKKLKEGGIKATAEMPNVMQNPARTRTLEHAANIFTEEVKIEDYKI